DVADGPHLREQPLQLVGAERERVAARDEDVPDLAVAADVVEGRRQVVAREFLLAAHQAPAVAGAAIDEAARGHEQQHAVGGYLCTRPGAGLRASSPSGSSDSPGARPHSCARGITCMRIGQAGWARSTSEK